MHMSSNDVVGSVTNPITGIMVCKAFVDPAECERVLHDIRAKAIWDSAVVGRYEQGILQATLVDPTASSARVATNYKQQLDVVTTAQACSKLMVGKCFGLNMRRFSNYGVSWNAQGTSVGRHRDTTTFSTQRIVTNIVYLNDGYCGGNLAFPDLGIKIRPKKGDLVIFLSEYFHMVETITKGDRYCIIFFGEN